MNIHKIRIEQPPKTHWDKEVSIDIQIVDENRSFTIFITKGELANLKIGEKKALALINLFLKKLHSLDISIKKTRINSQIMALEATKELLI